MNAPSCQTEGPAVTGSQGTSTSWDMLSNGGFVVSLGEGKIIGTSVNGRVGVAGYLYRTGYRGWSVPYFPAAG